MWEYSGKKDSMRLCSEDLKEAEVDAKMKSITALTKGQDVPKRFEKEPFSASLARTEVFSSPLVSVNFFFRVGFLIESLSLFLVSRGGAVLSSAARGRPQRVA
jgi:hypothetical protein